MFINLIINNITYYYINGVLQFKQLNHIIFI